MDLQAELATGIHNATPDVMTNRVVAACSNSRSKARTLDGWIGPSNSTDVPRRSILPGPPSIFSISTQASASV
jgi:hypothetical protein